MFFSGHLWRGLMVVKKLPGLVERQAQRRPDLPGRQLTFGKALQHERLQKPARMKIVALQMELLGELVRNLNGDGHQKIYELSLPIARRIHPAFQER